MLVEWYRFASFRLARQEFKRIPCVYAFVDPDSHLPDYVGKTSTGLGQRHPREPRASKGALVFVAPLAHAGVECCGGRTCAVSESGAFWIIVEGIWDRDNRKAT